MPICNLKPSFLITLTTKITDDYNIMIILFDDIGNYPLSDPYDDIREDGMDKPRVYYNQTTKDTPNIPNDTEAIGPDMLELEELTLHY